MMNKIIIDCDPGIDDSLAIMLGVYSKEVEIIGITTAAGNTEPHICAQNAIRILELCEKGYVPVYEGAKQPLTRQLTFSDSYCGIDGLGESTLAKPSRKVQEQNAVDFIIESVKQYKEIDIVAIAPMTNLAMAIQKEPELDWSRVNVITMAGYYKILGDAFVGRPRCEWNVLVDPEAYEVVIHSGMQFRAIGLDITAQLTNEMMEELLSHGIHSKRMEFLKEVVAFNVNKGLKMYSILVDAVAMAYAIDRDLATFETGTIEIDCSKELDEHSISFKLDQEIANLYVAKTFDFEGYIKMLRERVFSA